MGKSGVFWRAGAAVLAAAMLAGCGATADLAAQSAVRPAASGGGAAPGLTGGLENSSQAALSVWAWGILAAQTGDSAETAAEDLQTAIDAFCAAQPGSISVWACDLEDDAVYKCNADVLYYGASILKSPYALWLCKLADDGKLAIGGALPNTHRGLLAQSSLSAYNESDTVPVREALYAMIADSDNDATDLLMQNWPGTEASGYTAFLQALGYSRPDTVSMTSADGIQGELSAADAGATMQALWHYMDSGAPNSAFLRQAFTSADHEALYVPAGVAAAKKYGSWDGAFHDEILVFDENPYILCCLTDWGSSDVDFPAEAVEKMQALGKLVSGFMRYGL